MSPSFVVSLLAERSPTELASIRDKTAAEKLGCALVKARAVPLAA
jgi:hypothetical protein